MLLKWLHADIGYGSCLVTTKYQDNFDNFFFVVDLHAITVPQDPKQLKAGVTNAVATYLAAGIDPEKSKVFVQVRVATNLSA